MLTSLTAPAFAKTWCIEDGNITVKAGDTGNDVTQKGETTYGDKDTIITNQNKDIASSNTVTIETKDKDDKAKVTFENVNIEADSGSALTSKGDVTLTLKGDNHLTGGNGGSSSYGGDGITSSGSLTISGGTVNATGRDGKDGDGGNGIWSGGVTISSGTVTANGGGSGNVSGDGIRSSGGVTISGGKVKAAGGDSKDGYGGNGIIGSGRVAISGGTVNAAGGDGGNGKDGGYGIISNDIDLSGSLELTAKAGSPNGKALSQRGNELDLDTINKDKLDPGAKVTAINANGDSKQVSIPRPVEPEKPVIPEESSSSSDGGSSAPSAPVSSLPGLTVTDKSGAVISYTSTQSGNTLTVCVGRFAASLRASLSTLRQLRAEGIETITFQTILCSTTLSVDELLAMGGEDAEAVLTHRSTDSSLTVG